MEELSLVNIEASNFEEFINQIIEIAFTDIVKLEAEIIEVTRLRDIGVGRAPFSVVFRTAQKTEYYQQGTYTVFLPSKASLELFLVPIGFDKLGMKYEAIFS
jgi:hypothetical protein